MEALIKITAVVFGILGLVFVLSFINAVFVSLLWNWLVPILLTKGPLTATITYWQAWGISFLCGMLFKGSTTCNCSKS